MGLIGKVKSWLNTTRNGAKIAEIKGAIHGTLKTLLHTSGIGDDSQALPGDYVVTVRDVKTGRETIVGYIDPNCPQNAGAGEKIIYSRDASGAVVAKAWLKNTGEIELSNDLASLTIDPTGEFGFSGPLGSFTIDAAGLGTLTLPAGFNVIANTAITGTLFNNGKNIGDTHGHSQPNDSAGNTEQNITGVL